MAYHIKQNNIGCRKEIREYGCFFRSCGLIAEYKTLKSLTVTQLNEGWDYCKKEGFIDDKDNVKLSDAIINYFLHVLGGSGKFVEIGTFENGVKNLYSWSKKCNLSTDALIQKIGCNGYYGTHFRPVNNKGALIEDPHEPEINVHKIYYSILYHYFKGE